VRRVVVIVPAHEEREQLPGCLAAIAAAAGVAAPTPVRVVVVADSCTDDTAELAAAAGADVVTVRARNVGLARAAGVAHALHDGAEGLWLATTDADTRVPPRWLRWQLEHADAGADLLAGTVEVDDWSPWPAGLRARYDSRYSQLITGVAHAHVHGANLGFSPAAYLAAGGFPAVRHDEDRALVARARATGARVVTDAGCPVRTSSRAVARAPQGFAGHLLALTALLAREDQVS
jgi:hypothetical protein